MSDTHSAVSSIDALATVAATAEDIDTQVASVNFNIGFFGFGQHRNGDGTGMDATLAFGGRDALDAVNTTFKFQE